MSYRSMRMTTHLQIPQRPRDGHVLFTADLHGLGVLHEIDEVAYAQDGSGRILGGSVFPKESVDSALDAAVALARRLLAVGEPADESDDEGRCLAWELASGRVSISVAKDAFVALQVFLRAEKSVTLDSAPKSPSSVMSCGWTASSRTAFPGRVLP